MPRTDEGLPIILLEALNYGLPVLTSDVHGNKEIGLSANRYFRCGDVDDLKEKMAVLLEKGLSEDEQQEMANQIEEKYNPSTISRIYGAPIAGSTLRFDRRGRQDCQPK